MEPRRSKTEQFCNEVRLGLQKGQYVAGDRIDPKALAKKFHTSLTPVRYALHGLSVKGVLEDHGRAGFRVPLLTEFELRDHYDWMEWLLVLASNVGQTATRGTADLPQIKKRGSDVVALTRELFDEIALATGRPSLCEAVQLVNDKLGGIRRIERALVDDALDELATLHRVWLKANLTSLQTALFDYHERRRKLVPHIVAILNNKTPNAAANSMLRLRSRRSATNT